MTYTLGQVFYRGDYIKKNLTQTISWFQKAAKVGHANADYFLGEISHYKQFLEKDLTSYKKSNWPIWITLKNPAYQKV